MPNINIANLTQRPGIITQEFDRSQFETPEVRGLNSLVLGFSENGPFNKPVNLITNSDLRNTFGSIDRRLERKGSFFHRTIAKLLESNPVKAINLLLTDDTLDIADYQSFSTSTGNFNDIKRSGPYRRFFDRAGFWERSTDAFNNLANEDPNASERILNFTNLNKKKVTIFAFKAENVEDFDVDMVEYYGNPENIPPYVYPTDYVSDYMIDIVVVSGDWTDYEQLAVDQRWGQYFNNSGLRKDQVLNFINDPASSISRYYQGLSLIPYFRDPDGRNIFVETVVNRDTDETGVFCAFDIDALEDNDYPTGLIDLVGNSIIGDSDIEEINFLSYNDVISEKVTNPEKVLDTPGNVISYGADYKDNTMYVNKERTSWNSEFYVHNITKGDINIGGSPADSEITIDVVASEDLALADDLQKPYVIIGGQKIEIEDGTYDFTINSSDYVVTSGSETFHSVVYIDISGEIQINNSLVAGAKSQLNANDIALFDIEFDVDGNNEISNLVVNDVTIDSNGFIELDSSDITTSVSNGNITWLFNGTAQAPDTSEYATWRKIRFFNTLINALSGPNKDRMVLVIDDNNKASLEDMNVTNIQTGNTVNKEFTLETGLDDSVLTDISLSSPAVYSTLFYLNDDEFLLGTTGVETKMTPYDPSEDKGIVARYSQFYLRYFNGVINTGDYFYENRIDNSAEIDVEFIMDNGTAYIAFSEAIPFNSNDRIILPQSTANDGIFTISNPIANDEATPVAGFFAYEVSESIVEETLEITRLWDANKKHHLRMFKTANGILSVRFMDPDLVSDKTIDLNNNQELVVFSQKTNFQQSIDILTPPEWEESKNKILIDGQRYPEVKVGDFLSADYNEDDLEPGQMPKSMTRILSKRAWSVNPQYSVLTTDSAIKVWDFDGELQTLRFTKIQDYITDYKGFKLKGFKPRLDSMPDGTEERQNEILDIVEKGSNMFKALTDKEVISFRYLVDSFGLGLTENSKQQLVDICGERLDCFGFINMPSIKLFKESTSPTFVDNEGVINTEFIKSGGDLESNPAFLYSFAEGNGVSTVGYFTPYLTVNDNGRPLNVPPAAWVATTYWRKHQNTNPSIKPWTISAGVQNGRITGIAGLEHNFTGEDIANLNKMKANPIVSKRNRGFVIETQNTAQTLSRSALGVINVREVLIEIEQELRDMLLNFQWKFNTPEIRAEIKLRADSICEKYQNQNGLFNYFNKIDSENNPPDLIDQQIGRLDTYLEPTKGMAVIVNNVTILRTGQIESGGFL